MPPYFLGRDMDFRTFEENADAAAERRERVKQQQADTRERMAQKRKASMEKLKDKKVGSKPSQPTSMASDHKGTTHHSRDADED